MRIKRTFDEILDVGEKCQFCWRTKQEAGGLRYCIYDTGGNTNSGYLCEQCKRKSWKEKLDVYYLNQLDECQRCGKRCVINEIEDKYFNYLCSECIFYRDCLEEKWKSYGKRTKKRVQDLQEGN